MKELSIKSNQIWSINIDSYYKNLFIQNKEKAACLNSITDVFFPNTSLKDDSKEIVNAKKICNQCEIKNDCLNFALSNDEPDGVWGGLSHRERKKLKRIKSI